ncbi:MAG: tetratricopeptide repeat protein [Acidobacteria bacterium]|nr:tetratricopeptide repeat protein [Acidobacteriota bacterium]
MTMRQIVRGSVAALALFAVACSSSETEKQRALENGNRYLDEKKYAEAIVEYQNAVRIDPRFGEARKKLADAYGYAGNHMAAYAEQIRAADLLPDDVDAQIKASMYLLLGGQYDDAKARVQQALALDPKNIQGLLILGNALAGVGDLGGAIAQIEQAITIDPTKAGSYASLGEFKLGAGDRSMARAAYEKAVTVDPKSVPARVALATFQWGIGSPAAAEQSFKAALQIDPQNQLANRALASYYVSTGRPQDAEPLLRIVAEAGGETEKLMLADYYVAHDRPGDARDVLDPMVRNERVSSGAEVRLAQLAYFEKRTTDAHAAVDRVLTREPRNASALMTKARWLNSEGKIAEALRLSTEAAAADPLSAPAQYLLGAMRAASGQYSGAAEAFTEALRLNPRAAAAQVQLSRLTLLRGDPAGAVQYAQEALNSAPDSPVARMTLAHGLLVQGQTVRAEAEIAALVKEYPDVALVRVLNGTLKGAKKDVAGARGEYERALQLDANSVDALTGLVVLDLNQGNVAAARARVETRLRAQPDRTDLLMLAARVYFDTRDMAKAEGVLRHLIQIDSANMSGYAMLGQVYLAQRKLDEAKAEFDKRAASNPKDAPSRLIVAMILEVQGKVPEAKQKYEEVLTIEPRSLLAANNLAYLYAQASENLDRALALAQTAVEVAPNSPEARDTLGWVYYQQGLAGLAVVTLKEAVARNASSPSYHYHLGLAYLKNGNRAEARASFEQVLRLNPAFPAAADVRRTLATLEG